MDFAQLIQDFLSHDAAPLAQFIKYAVVGGIATATHIGAFFLIGFYLFPCVSEQDIVVRLLRLKAPVIQESLRARYAIYSNLVAFFVSNVVCYILNRLYVFQPGRHAMWIEFSLFLAVSAISMGIGTTIMSGLIKRLRMQTTYAFAANIFTSLALNFVLRKFLVFQG